MNKIFKSKWNARLGAWVAVSEIAAAHGKRNRLRRNAALTLALTGALFQMSGAKAACGDSVTSVFATGGSTCSGQLTSYDGANVAYAIGSGSTLTFTAPSVTVDGNNRASTLAMESGGVNSGGTTPQPGATIHALGNLRVYGSTGRNSRGIYIDGGVDASGNPNKVIVDGNLTAVRLGTSSGGAAVENAGGLIDVKGTTTMSSTNTDVLRNAGTALFYGATSLTTTDFGRGILNGGGTLTFKDNLTIATNLNDAITQTGGVLTSEQSSTLSTKGIKAYALHASGASTVANFNQLAATTLGANGAGVLADEGAIVNIADANSSITTVGSGAAGVYALNSGSIGMGAPAPNSGGASVLLAGGTITTSGTLSSGALAETTLSGGITSATQTGGSIYGSGLNAQGVVAQSSSTSTGTSLSATQSGGLISLSGLGSTGVFALSQGSGDSTVTQQAGGRVIASGSGASFGMSAQTTLAGNALAVQDAGGSITIGSGTGIVASTTSGGTGNATVMQNGSIVATGGSLDPVSGNEIWGKGVEATAYGSGMAIVEQGSSGTIDSAHTGITAHTTNGDINITQGGRITTAREGSQGISASTAGPGSITIAQTDTGTITSQGDAIVAVSTQGKSVVTAGQLTSVAGTGVNAYGSLGVDVTTLAGKTLSSQLDGIRLTVPTTTSPSTVTQNGTIVSSAGNGIDTTQALGGTTIVNMGNITAISAGKFVISGSDAVENVTQAAGTLTGNTELGGGNDVMTANGGTVIGGIGMGLGSDTLTLSSPFDVSQLTYLDGGDDASDADGMIDILQIGTSLTGSSTSAGTAGDVKIVNWENINIGNASTLTLTGDLSAARTGILAGSTLALSPTTTSATVTGDVANAGTIDLHTGNTAPVNSLTINGNYTGKNGSKLLVDSTWNNANSLTTDSLTINGSASGSTTVSVPGGIFGDVTQAEQAKVSDKPVVTVSNAHAETVFTGSAPTSNAGEAQLLKVGNNYHWTLLAKAKPTDPTPTIPIYDEPVSAYVQTPLINKEMGFAQMGKLHERVGEQQTWAWDDCGTRCQQYQQFKDKGQKKYPVWGRLNGEYLKLQGDNRFALRSKTGFVQFGVDIDNQVNLQDGSRRHNGAMLTYGWGSTDFFDKNRAQNGVVVADKYTGKADTDMLSLGGYSTWYAKNGTYLDLVGNVSWLRNKYRSRDGVGASQNGYGLGLSAEMGRPWRIGESQWQIEPQAQLSYQHIHLNGFNDGVREVSGQSLNGLRGRVGARLAWNAQAEQLRTKTFYLTANVLHDFKGTTPSATLGREEVRDSYGRTWGEVGIGGQTALSKATYLYGDVRYQRSLDGNKGALGGARREGYHGRIGVRHTW